MKDTIFHLTLNLLNLELKEEINPILRLPLEERGRDLKKSPAERGYKTRE